jgi:O-methyltransferase
VEAGEKSESGCVPLQPWRRQSNVNDWLPAGTEAYHLRAGGHAAFADLCQTSFYAYMAGHPQVGAPFKRWMTRSSELDNAAVVVSYDFAPFRTVVDVGGGQGQHWRRCCARTLGCAGCSATSPRS